jgi:cell division protein ZapA (FtsZ GTPase activity inhibitor)
LATSIKIKFLGREYNIKSDKDEAYIQQLHQYIEEKAQEAVLSARAVSSMDVVVLTLLNVADDYISLRDHFNQTFDSRLQRMIDSIEATSNEVSACGVRGQ